MADAEKEKRSKVFDVPKPATLFESGWEVVIPSLVDIKHGMLEVLEARPPEQMSLPSCGSDLMTYAGL